MNRKIRRDIEGFYIPNLPEGEDKVRFNDDFDNYINEIIEDATTVYYLNGNKPIKDFTQDDYWRVVLGIKMSFSGKRTPS